MEKHILNLLQKSVPQKNQDQNSKNKKNLKKESKEIQYKNDAIFPIHNYPLKNVHLNEKQFSVQTNRPQHIQNTELKKIIINNFQENTSDNKFWELLERAEQQWIIFDEELLSLIISQCLFYQQKNHDQQYFKNIFQSNSYLNNLKVLVESSIKNINESNIFIICVLHQVFLHKITKNQIISHLSKQIFSNIKKDESKKTSTQISQIFLTLFQSLYMSFRILKIQNKDSSIENLVAWLDSFCDMFFIHSQLSKTSKQSSQNQNINHSVFNVIEKLQDEINHQIEAKNINEELLGGIELILENHELIGEQIKQQVQMDQGLNNHLTSVETIII